MRKKIIMMPSWYPTKINPISGSFFKEQAEALSEQFDFCVIGISYSSYSLIKYAYKYIFHKLNSKITLVNSNGIIPEIYCRGNIISLGIISRFFLRMLHKNEKSIKDRQISGIYDNLYNYLVNEKNYRPDLIYAMTAQINGVDAYNLGSRFGVPVILAEHCPFPLEGTVVSSELKNAFSGCDKLLAVSHDKARQILMQDISCSPIVVGNLVDEELFQIKEKPRNKDFTILIVAANNFYKDYQTFFRAMNHLRNTLHQSFQIYIVGYCPSPDIAELEKNKALMEAELDENNIKDISHLYPKIDRAEIVHFYQLADVFVLTSIQEGLPVSTLEAACCGLPVFSTKCGGVEDYLDDTCGRLFNIRDHKALAESLRDFIEGKIQFDSDHIRKKIISLYGREAFVSRISTIFNEVINEKKEYIN